MSCSSARINIGYLVKARYVFIKFYDDWDKGNFLNIETQKTAILQSFGSCYELCFKTLKKVLEQRGLKVKNPKNIFTEAAKQSLISDPKDWFDFMEKNNMRLKAYEDEILDEIVGSLDSFPNAVKELIENIRNLQ